MNKLLDSNILLKRPIFRRQQNSDVGLGMDMVRSAPRFGSDGRCAPVCRVIADETETGARWPGERGRRLTRAMQLLGSTASDGKDLQPIATLVCDFKPGDPIATDARIYAIVAACSTAPGIAEYGWFAKA